MDSRLRGNDAAEVLKPDTQTPQRKHRVIKFRKEMVMRLRSLIVVRSIFIIGCVISIGGEPSAQQGWHTYCHARFGQCADIPPNFQSDPPPVNGDGLGFRDPYGMSIAVFARNNVQSSTLSSERSELLNEKRFPAYQAAGRDWFVLSGGADNKIYYIRRIVTPETIATLWIEYPIQRREMHDHLISRISQSFKLIR